MRIYDCSNSNERPAHRGGGGPVENSVVTLLKKSAHFYDSEFINNPEEADIIFTNDIYPSNVLKLNKKKVKRMDGIFWQKSLMERNIPLNKAAKESDHVIFISEFSRNSYESICGEITFNNSVVLNAVDQSIFKYIKRPKQGLPYTWIASASNWGRKEKRFEDILYFSELIKIFGAKLKLIGTIPDNSKLPKNVILLGYLSDPNEIYKELCNSDAFVNFSYRDAAPKSVIEAAATGLPIFFANSGGLREIIYNGTYIPDEGISDEAVPRLNPYDVWVSHIEFLNNFLILNENHYPQDNCDKMVKDYFEVFENVL